MTLCGNYDGPNRALPCCVEVNTEGRHKGRHEAFPGNPDGLNWPQRRAIWEKEDFFLIADVRKDMDPEVVEIGDNLLITWNFDWQRAPMGRFDDVKVTDGEITGIVSWFDKDGEHAEDLLVHGDVRFGGYYTKVETRKDGEKKETVTKCLLTGVSLVLNSQMPGATINRPGPES